MGPNNNDESIILYYQDRLFKLTMYL